MPRSVSDLTPAALDFLSEYRLASLATTRQDGTPHVCAVGFTIDVQQGIARVITFEGSQKVRNTERDEYAALTHVDGPRWLTVEGPARVLRDPRSVRDAEARYAARYREPRPNPSRVVLEVSVTRLMGAASMFRVSADR